MEIFDKTISFLENPANVYKSVTMCTKFLYYPSFYDIHQSFKYGNIFQMYCHSDLFFEIFWDIFWSSNLKSYLFISARTAVLYIVKQVGCKNWSMNSDFKFLHKKRNFLTWLGFTINNIYYLKYIQYCILIRNNLI